MNTTPDKPNGSVWTYLLVYAIIAAVIVAVLGIAGGYWGQGLLIVAFVSFFPLSYIAYRNFRAPVQIDRLAEDFQLLGLAGRPTTKGAQDRAREMAEKRYSQSYAPMNYVMHIALTILLTVVGLTLFFWPPGGNLLSLNTLEAMRYGFLGAFLFSVQLIYRRYTTFDLQPTVYLYSALTLVAGMIFNYVAFEAISSLTADPQTQAVTGIGAGALAIVAFSLGYFPYLALRWFDRVAHNALGFSQRRADELPLGLIDGISQWHETRLRDNGIDNVQNLASAEIVDLLVHTTFSGQQVIDWVDQAILYLYLEPNAIDRFRDSGVRTTSDFRDLWRDATSDQKAGLAQQLQSNVNHLDLLYKVTEAGPNLHYVLSYWTNAGRLARQRQEFYLAEMIAQYRAVVEQAGATPVYATAELERLSAQANRLREEITEETGREPALPETPLTLVGEGKLHLQAGRMEQALAKFQRALELDPNMALAHAVLGEVYLKTGQVELAGQHYQRAVELEPDSPVFLNDRAIYYRRTGKLDEARQDLERAIALKPGFALAHVNLGNVYRDLGDYNRAIEHYRSAIAIDSALAVAYNNLAWVYADKLNANLGEALALARRAVELSQQNGQANPAYLDTLAAVQIKLGKLNDARESLLKAQAAPFLEAHVLASIESHLDEIKKLQNGA